MLFSPQELSRPAFADIEDQRNPLITSTNHNSFPRNTWSSNNSYHGTMGCDSHVGVVALQIGIVPNQPFWNSIQITGNVRLVTPYPEACNFSLCYVPEAYLNRFEWMVNRAMFSPFFLQLMAQISTAWDHKAWQTPVIKHFQMIYSFTSKKENIFQPRLNGIYSFKVSGKGFVLYKDSQWLNQIVMMSGSNSKPALICTIGRIVRVQHSSLCS